jgi:hypothetical protein
MDETNGSVDLGQIEMSVFDHPRSDPDDLPGCKGLLHHEPADHGIADLQRAEAGCCMVIQRRCSSGGHATREVLAVRVRVIAEDSLHTSIRFTILRSNKKGG